MSIHQIKSTQQQQDDRFSSDPDHQVAMTLHSLAGDVQNFQDLARDPKNRDMLIRQYRIIAELHRDFTTAIEMMWRPK